MQGCGTLWGYFLIKGLLTGSILQGFIRTFWCCDTSLPTARLQAVHEDWVVDCSESLHTNIRFVLSSTFVKTDVRVLQFQAGTQVPILPSAVI